MGDRRTRGRYRIAVIAGTALALSACQSLPKIPDRPATATAPPLQYRFADLAKGPGNTDGLLVLLAFSGGGARASAMAYGVLEVLNATRIGRGARRRSLLSEVDVISGTSGGSFTAAFYGLFRQRMFEKGPDGLTLFERRYLKRPVTKSLKSSVLGNLIRINTAAVNRSDVAAELYEKTIFGKRTFGDLLRAGRPLIAINADDTTKLSRFVFTQAQFDLICGNLSTYPVARAVTASSAVHGVFAPIKLRNFSPNNRNCPPEPAWVAAALKGEPTTSTVIETPRDRRRLARLARWYRTGEPYGRTAVRGSPYYVHLADGGVENNVALWPILRGLDSPISDWGLRKLLASGRVRRVLLIVVNAMPRADNENDRKPAGPTVVQDAAVRRLQRPDRHQPRRDPDVRRAVRADAASISAGRLRRPGRDRVRGDQERRPAPLLPQHQDGARPADPGDRRPAPPRRHAARARSPVPDLPEGDQRPPDREDRLRRGRQVLPERVTPNA